MKKFTNEQIKSLAEETSKIVSEVSQGKATREIMAEIYVDRLENKKTEQGLAMADKIIESVRNFDKEYMQARENLDEYLKDFAKKAEKGKNTEERCNYWLKLEASVTAACIALNDNTVDRAKMAEELKNLCIPTEQISEEKAEELRTKALEAIKNSGIVILGIQQTAEQLENVTAADETASMLIDIGTRETDTRAIMSMLAYTEVKNGAYDEVPVEMTAEQITTAVCATIEEARIAEGVENGSILEEVAAIMLTVLGVVVIAVFALALANLSFAVIPAFYSSFLACHMAKLAVWGILILSVQVISSWIDKSKNIVKFSAKCIKAICRGFRYIASFIKETIIPGAVNLAKKAWNGLRKLFGGKKETQGEDIETTEIGDSETIDIDCTNGNPIAVV